MRDTLWGLGRRRHPGGRQTRGAPPCARFPPELRRRELGADPSPVPARFQSPPRRWQVPGWRREERAATGTYLSAVRPRGCAPEHGPGGGADCALPELRLPPAVLALPHRPPPPLGRGRQALVRGQRPALPHRATLGPLHPETTGRDAASGQAGPPASPGLRGDARERGNLDPRLGSFHNLEPQNSNSTTPTSPLPPLTAHPTVSQCSVGPGIFPSLRPPGAQNPCRHRQSTKPRTRAQ